METITIIPTSKRQGKIIKALLEEMKVRFTTVENDKAKVSEEAKKSIREGIEAAENNDFLTEEESRKLFHDAIYQMD
ncbi:hypothetical protein [Petrimonas sp.]|uniref:hypothetical protein n=1 Tax=Petrimonas sp. TaxID=2023866 RepID=UPI003F51A911